MFVPQNAEFPRTQNWDKYCVSMIPFKLRICGFAFSVRWHHSQFPAVAHCFLLAAGRFISSFIIKWSDLDPAPLNSCMKDIWERATFLTSAGQTVSIHVRVSINNARAPSSFVFDHLPHQDIWTVCLKKLWGKGKLIKADKRAPQIPKASE